MIPAPPNKEHLNTKAATVVAAAVMLSRILGLARDLIFATLFGAGRNMDSFLTAFRIPNLLRDLFAEGALSTAFVTVFSKKIATEGEASAWKLASKIALLTTIFMSLLSLLGILLADHLIALLAPGFSPEKATLTIYLTQIMYPFILFVSLAALVMGMLNSVNRFTAPALASSFFNIGSIVGGVILGWCFDHNFGERSFIGLSIGTLIGGLLQFGIQIPSLYQAGFRFIFNFSLRDPSLRKVLSLMLPATIAASAVQINVMINTMFASLLGDGPISWLSYAFRLMQLPLGVFGVALATVTLPLISRASALGDLGKFQNTLAKAMRLAIFFTIPSAIGLIVFAQAIIAMIYQRGKFHSSDTLHTSEALQYYAIGLVSYSCIKVLAPAFYALNRKWIPMIVSIFSVGINLLLNWFFIMCLEMGHRGLALSTALSATINFGILYMIMRNILGSLESRAMLNTLIRCLLASIPIGILGYYATSWLTIGIHGSILLRNGSLLLIIFTGALLFLIASLILKIEGIHEASKMLLGKIIR